MKIFAKAALGALMLTGAAVAASAPAEARVGVFLNLGVPAPLYAPAYAPAYAPGPAYAGCYGSYYGPACAYPAYGEPVFWNGGWYNNAPYRMIGGRREFWVHDGWRNARPHGRGFHR